MKRWRRKSKEGKVKQINMKKKIIYWLGKVNTNKINKVKIKLCKEIDKI